MFQACNFSSDFLLIPVENLIYLLNFAGIKSPLDLTSILWIALEYFSCL